MTFYLLLLLFFFTKDEKYGQLFKILFKKKNLSVQQSDFISFQGTAIIFAIRTSIRKTKCQKNNSNHNIIFFIIFSYSFDVQSFLVSLDFCFVLFFISILKRGSFFFEGAFTMVLL